MAKKIKNIPEVPETTDTPVKAEEKIESVSFKLKNGAIRVFSPEVHGEEFAEIAKTFENTNKHIIVK